MKKLSNPAKLYAISAKLRSFPAKLFTGPVKRYIFVLTALIVPVLLTACGRHGQVVRMTAAAPQDSACMAAAQTFGDLVEKRTRGRYRIEIESGMNAGISPLLENEIELDLHPVSDLQSVEEKLAVVAMPYLFADTAQADEILFNGTGKDALFDLIRAAGVEPLALGENGFRQISNNARSVISPADLAGLSIRIPDNALLKDLYRQFGAQPVVMDWESAFPALENDEIDGQDNPMDPFHASDAWKIQRYLTLWNCSYDPVCISVSGGFWETLAEDDREIFRTAAEEACQAETAAVRAEQSGILAEISADGVEVTELSDEEREAFRLKAAPLYSQWRDRIGDELFAAFGITF